MATITKLERPAGVVYKARVRRQGQAGEVSRTFTTRRAAELWARKFEAALDQDNAGLTSEAQRHTLADAIRRYRLEILPTRHPSTQPNYGRHLDYWERRLGHLRLSEVQAVRIAEARDELGSTPQKPKREGAMPRLRTPSTVHRYLASLGAVLSACVKRWHWLAESPLRQVEKPSMGAARTRFLSENELHCLLDACRASRSPDLHLAVLLAITTGARAGEILGCRWRDLDLDAGQLRVRVDNETTTKGGVRILPLVPQVLPLLHARREQQRAGRVIALRDDALVFPSRVSAAQPVDLRQPFKTALQRAGIEGFRWHDLRHSCASFLAERGASLLEIGAVLGHRATQTTKRYAHLTEQHTHELVRGMADKILGGKS